jgi:hypothetical protein
MWCRRLVLPRLTVSYALEMNAQHLQLCASPEWAEVVEHVLLPWVLSGRQLRDQVLEVGAGPGLVTPRSAPASTALADAHPDGLPLPWPRPTCQRPFLRCRRPARTNLTEPYYPRAGNHRNHRLR